MEAWEAFLSRRPNRQRNVGASGLEVALAALACAESQLRFAYIPKISQAAMDILPFYSALHSIDLGSGGHEDPLLGPQPLAPLPSLGKLLLAKHSSQGVELL